MDTENARLKLAENMALLAKEDKGIEQIRDEKVPVTPLPREVKILAGALLPHSDRLGHLFGSVPTNNGWSLAIAEIPRTDSRRCTATCLVAQKQGRKIRLSQGVWFERHALLVKPSEVLGAVQALSTLPAVLLAWQADVEKGKKEAVRKLQNTEGELVEAEKQLHKLCRELIEVSQQILGSTEEKR